MRLNDTNFASTQPLMLPSISPREALLACPPFPFENLPSFTVESTLSFLCSRFDPPLSLTKGQFLPTLTLSPLMIWYSGLTALFLFILAKAAPAYLPTALFVALRPLFPSQQAQYVQVFPLKPAPFCKLFTGLSGINKSATSLLLSDSCSVLATLFSPPSFLLPQSLWQELSFLGNDAADELVRQGALLVPSAIPCSLSLISHICSCLFSDWRHIVSSKFFNTQVPSIATEELVLPRHAHCVLSHLCCHRHSLLLSSYLSRISRIENSFCSTCGHSSQHTSHLILHCPAWTLCTAHSLATLCLFTTSGPGPGELPCLWGSMVFCHAPIPRKGSGNQQQQHKS